MSSKRIFRFAYHASQISDVRMRTHQVRDADAFLELLPLLNRKGYRYEHLLLNPPSERRKGAPIVDLSIFRSSDLLVLTTRPPIHDKKAGDKRRIRRSYTNLEKLVFASLKPKYFKFCARSNIILSKAVARRLAPDFKQKADMLFHSAVGSSYVRYRALGERLWQIPPADDKRTAVFLIQVPAIWPGGPKLLVTFSMAGTETLIWNYLLRKRFSRWLNSYRFLMAELVLQDIPKKPVDLFLPTTGKLPRWFLFRSDTYTYKSLTKRKGSKRFQPQINLSIICINVTVPLNF
jgi:hypothetical protein